MSQKFPLQTLNGIAFKTDVTPLSSDLWLFVRFTSIKETLNCKSVRWTITTRDNRKVYVCFSQTNTFDNQNCSLYCIHWIVFIVIYCIYCYLWNCIYFIVFIVIYSIYCYLLYCFIVIYCIVFIVIYCFVLFRHLRVDWSFTWSLNWIIVIDFNNVCSQSVKLYILYYIRVNHGRPNLHYLLAEAG